MLNSNRIVVDYKGQRKLVLLAKIHTQSGEEKSYENLQNYANFGFEVTKRYDGIKDIGKLKELDEPNKEGFVVRFKSGIRIKIKYETYIRLHRLVTGVNAKAIWDLLRHGQPLDELLDKVPDEFFSWVKNTKSSLEEKFTVVKESADKAYSRIKDLPSRKEQAMAIMQNADSRQYSGIIFKMLDKKPYDEIVWKMIRPVAEKPFKEDIDS